MLGRLWPWHGDTNNWENNLPPHKHSAPVRYNNWKCSERHKEITFHCHPHRHGASSPVEIRAGLRRRCHVGVTLAFYRLVCVAQIDDLLKPSEIANSSYTKWLWRMQTDWCVCCKWVGREQSLHKPMISWTCTKWQISPHGGARGTHGGLLRPLLPKTVTSVRQQHNVHH